MSIEPVGHEPDARELKPSDEKLFQTFQSNLLSLISHELRTPLTGILNSLNLLDESFQQPELTDQGGFTLEELIQMAKRNAQRLHHTLASLLDLAAMESGTFHVRLKEADLPRIVQKRLDSYRTNLEAAHLKIELTKIQEKQPEQLDHPVLLDSQKFGRVVDLCLQIVLNHGLQGTPIHFRVGSNQLVIRFHINPLLVDPWKDAWLEASAGVQSGLASTGSLFGSALRSEEAFLSRNREGLGSEIFLILEIIRRHQGTFQYELNGEEMALRITVPHLSSIESLRAVLMARIYEHSTDLGSVALSLIQIPKKDDLSVFRSKIRKCLFRASDAVYSLPEQHRLAVVLNDCKPEDGPRLIERIQKTLGTKLDFGLVTCPDEGSDPDLLLGLAEKRLQKSL